VAERVSPHSLEAERAVLGKLLLRPAQIADVVDDLQSGEFFRPAHGEIYTAMTDLWRRGVAVDFVTLRDDLSKRGRLDEVGGMAYVAKMVDGLPPSDVTEHVRLVREKARLRDLINESRAIAERAYAEDDEADALVEDAETRIRGIAHKATRGGFVSGADLSSRIVASVQAWHSGSNPGLATGFADLDDLTGGFQPGDLILIAARPSMGKSSFIGQVAHHVAVRLRQPVALFSLEMSVESVGVRIAVADARVDLHQTRRGWLRPHDMHRLMEAVAQIEQSELYLDEAVTVRVADIRRKARQLHAQKGLGLLIVDYLQLLDAPKSRKQTTRNDDVSAISRDLKRLATEMRIPVVALSQLNRKVEERAEKRPTLADLRDSGALEQDADTVGFIYRPEVYTKAADDEGKAEFILAKQRNGPIGTVNLFWSGSSVRFDNITSEVGQAGAA